MRLALWFYFKGLTRIYHISLKVIIPSNITIGDPGIFLSNIPKGLPILNGVINKISFNVLRGFSAFLYPQFLGGTFRYINDKFLIHPNQPLREADGVLASNGNKKCVTGVMYNPKWDQAPNSNSRTVTSDASPETTH